MAGAQLLASPSKNSPVCGMRGLAVNTVSTGCEVVQFEEVASSQRAFRAAAPLEVPSALREPRPKKVKALESPG